MRLSRRHRWMLLAALATLVGGGALWWQRSSRVEPPLPEVQDDEVRQAIDAARQRVLDDRGSSAAWGQLGMVLLAHLFDQEAAACFTQAGRLDPRDPRWPYARGLIALKRDPPAALDLFRSAVQSRTEHGEDLSAMRLQLAEALLEQGQVEEAEERFREIQREQANDARAAWGLGLIALARGRQDEAESQFRVAQESPHARKRALVQRAILARSRGDRTAAEALDREAAEMPADPPWPDPILDETIDLQVGKRGRERRIARLEEHGRFEEAARLHLEQLEKAPTAESLVGAAVNLARLREFDRALELLAEAVRLAPDSPQAHYTLALVHFRKAEETSGNRFDSAQARSELAAVVEHARKATERKADHASAYLFWGLALKHLGRAGEAIGPLRRGVACRPWHLELQLALGEALLEAGRLDEARVHLGNARQIKPADPRAGRALDRLGPIPSPKRS